MKTNEITENKPGDVPYIVFESELARSERQIKRLWIALLVAIVLCAATNVCWLIYESSFETISYTQDGEGLNNINTGEQGDVYGTESQNQETEKSQAEENANP